MSKTIIRPVISALAIPAFALLSAVPALAQQTGEFELPETATPAPARTGNGQVQGPVDDSGIIPVGPRVIGPAPSPTSAPTPAPTAAPRAAPNIAPTAAPSAAPTTRATPRTTAQPAPRTSAPRPGDVRSSQSPDPRIAPDIRPPQPIGQVPTLETGGDAPSITDPIPADVGTGTGVTAGDGPSPATVPGPIEARSESADTSNPFWWWIIAALAGAALLVAAAMAIRRKQALAPIVAAPKASPGLMPAAAAKPAPISEAESAALAKAASEPDPMPSPAFVSTGTPSPAVSRSIAPLGLETQVMRMQRSMRAVTVTAKVVVTNRGTAPISNATLQGDLVGASRAAPLGEQLANAATDLDELEQMGNLAPGERREAIVQVRRELPEIEGIRQGNTVVFIPLLRIRFAGDGATPLASTVLVGHPPERSGGKPTPFLADAPPQNYDNVVGRALG